VVFLRGATGRRTQLVSTTRTGRQVRVLGTLTDVADPGQGGFDAGQSWAAVNGTVGSRSGIWTAPLGG
jgi:hypothetical protein